MSITECSNGENKKTVGNCFRKIKKLSKKIVDPKLSDDIMSHFCSKLGLNSTIQRAAAYIAKKAHELDLVPGRSDMSVFAAAIYLASQASTIKKSKKEIGDITGVVEGTIRCTYQCMIKRAAELFPANFVFDTPIERLPLA